MDLILGIVGIGLSIVVFAMSFKYDNYMYDVVGGGGFPRMLAVVITLCSAVIIVQYLRGRKKASAESAEKEGKGEKGEVKKGNTKTALLLILAVLIYIMALETVGYLVMTVLMVAFLLWIQNVRKPKTLILSTVIICGVLYVIFVLVLRVKMPTGFLI